MKRSFYIYQKALSGLTQYTNQLKIIIIIIIIIIIKDTLIVINCGVLLLR